MFLLREAQHSGLETELVDNFIERFSQEHLAFNDWVRFKMYTEVRVPEVRRRSDIVIYTAHKKLVNIEFKLHDLDEVLKQAIDHTKWADYSVVCMPANAFHNANMIWMQKFTKHGIGILLYCSGTFVEILKPYYRTYKDGKDRKIRTNVLSRLKNSQMILEVEEAPKDNLPQRSIPLFDGDKLVGNAILKCKKGKVKADIKFNKHWSNDKGKFYLGVNFKGGVGDTKLVESLSVKFKAIF